jgi:hypothetical protein
VQDLTVVAPRTPIPMEGRSSRRVVHHKGDHILFSRDQINRLFWNKITRASNSCWEWTGALFPNGYGRISFARRTLYPHRVSYELHNGAIPEGLHIDHLCRNRACCNPEHLEAVSCRENILRSPIAPASQNAAKTHCLYGHEYTEANTVTTKTGRNCRTCNRWRDRVAAAKKNGRPYEAAPPSATVTAKRPAGRQASCAQGHPYTAANTYVDPSGIRKCRTCAAEYRKRYKERRALSRPEADR